MFVGCADVSRLVLHLLPETVEIRGMNTIPSPSAFAFVYTSFRHPAFHCHTKKEHTAHTSFLTFFCGTQSDEENKVLYFYPQSTPLMAQLKLVALAQGASQFIKFAPCSHPNAPAQPVLWIFSSRHHHDGEEGNLLAQPRGRHLDVRCAEQRVHSQRQSIRL